MKYARFGLMLFVVFFVSTGCEEPIEEQQLDVPKLISPDSIIFSITQDGILFNWHPVSRAESYAIDVARNQGFTNLIYASASVKDTFVEVAFKEFEFDSTYYWRVAAYSDSLGWSPWSEPESFFHQVWFDLDTTYFPFRIGYEWQYERHAWSNESNFNSYQVDSYDTFIVKVIDSLWEEDTLYFTLEGSIYGLGNPVKIWDNGLIIFWNRISLIPNVTEDTIKVGGLELSYTDGSLSIDFRDSDEILTSRRSKGIGATSQGRYYQDMRGGFIDELLYFYNGQDTVFKASENEVSHMVGVYDKHPGENGGEK